MSNESKNTTGAVTSGLSFPTILFLIFLVLKLTKVISWSWIWVFAPLWISAGISVICFIILLIIHVYEINKI